MNSNESRMRRACCVSRALPPLVSILCHGYRTGERRHLTQSGDRDDDRPRVLADYGYLSGDSTPLQVAKDRRTGVTFAAAVVVKGGGDPHAARSLSKWTDGMGCQEVIVRTDGEPSMCDTHPSNS